MEPSCSTPRHLIVFFFAFCLSLILAQNIGGWKNQNPKDPKFKIIRAQSQVMAGTNYKIEIEFGLSRCSKDVDVSSVTEKNCPLGFTGTYLDYQVHVILVWDMPWKNRTRIFVVS
ncbi:hypothetical protein L596_028570 [Steinernema carpocapsae]|uniref:Cystatin domain-containing protein n=1 Tax=Steinernema carpocapsae TaxID=34508 RepID=A0A4U5LYT8_STECR|nr:hypothetical protein L596_028570 [Steinernema carpocapsae]